MSICAESVKCVCKQCSTPKLKWEWCNPCGVCENYKLVIRVKCREEKMKENYERNKRGMKNE